MANKLTLTYIFILWVGISNGAYDQFGSSVSDCDCSNTLIPDSLNGILLNIQETCGELSKSSSNRYLPDSLLMSNESQIAIKSIIMKNYKIWSGSIFIDELQIEYKLGKIARIWIHKGLIIRNYPQGNFPSSLIYCKVIQFERLNDTLQVTVRPDTISHVCDDVGTLVRYSDYDTIFDRTQIFYTKKSTSKSIRYWSTNEKTLFDSLPSNELSYFIDYYKDRVSTISYSKGTSPICIYHFRKKGRLKYIECNTTKYRPLHLIFRRVKSDDILSLIKEYPPIQCWDSAWLSNYDHLMR